MDDMGEKSTVQSRIANGFGVYFKPPACLNLDNGTDGCMVLRENLFGVQASQKVH